MQDQRRVRFANLDGLRRPGDIVVAADVWLDDLCRSSWATAEAMKVGTYLVRYMALPNPPPLSCVMIDRTTQTAPEQIKLALRLMNMYGPIESYVIDRDEIRIALHLSTLQRLRVLEIQNRLEILLREQAENRIKEQRWTPAAPVAGNEAGEPEPQPADAAA